jgi:hypothetical protein
MALIPGTLPNGTKYPSEPQSLLDTFASYLTAPEAKKNRPTVSVYTAVDGSTITARADGLDETIFLNHASDATSATLAFPSNTNSVTGQILRLFTAEAVTTLTVSLPGSVAIVGAALTTLADDDSVAWQKVAANTWVRLY